MGVGLSGMLGPWVPAFAGMTVEGRWPWLGASVMHATVWRGGSAWGVLGCCVGDGHGMLGGPDELGGHQAGEDDDCYRGDKGQDGRGR